MNIYLLMTEIYDNVLGENKGKNKFLYVKFKIRDYSLSQIIDKYILPEFWKISRNHIDKGKEYEYRYVYKKFRTMHLERNNINSKGIVKVYNSYLELLEEMIAILGV